jgi:hypothetical protein
VSVVIGMYGIGGVFVCADSHAISTDGIVTETCKLAGTQGGRGSFVIGNAADDGNAANMLAREILDAINSSPRTEPVESVVKRTMKDWHAGYVYSKAPSTQFALAARSGRQNRALYFCEPPNTVLQKGLDESVVIGLGAQIVDPLLPQVVRGPLYLREALIRAAYLMYRAKKEQAFLKGSDTHAWIISEAIGDIQQMTYEEMNAAEAVGPDVDFMLRYCYLGLLGVPRKMDQSDILEKFSESYLKVRQKVDAIEFPSLVETHPA